MNMLYDSFTHFLPRVMTRITVLAACAMLTCAAQAQTSTDAARDALAKQEGDVDQAALLKQTLTAADKQYSLIKTGAISMVYDMSYSYTGSQQINAKFTDSTLTLFNIENTRAHTVTNSLSIDYGFRDNITANVVLPLVSKYSESTSFSGFSHGMGDVQMGARWQPFEMRRDAPSFTTSATVRLPTGRSPFRTIDGQNLATGSGTAGLTLGANTSKIFDPIALFGSASLGLSLPAKHLNQVRDSVILRSVAPGPSVGFGGGFAYALSYDVSTTMSFQETVSFPSRLEFADGTHSRTSLQTSGVVNMGLGVRMSPLTTVNLSVGIGLTADSPDFTFGVNLPLNY
jgi:hypothetical protein